MIRSFLSITRKTHQKHHSNNSNTIKTSKNFKNEDKGTSPCWRNSNPLPFTRKKRGCTVKTQKDRDSCCGWLLSSSSFKPSFSPPFFFFFASYALSSSEEKRSSVFFFQKKKINFLVREREERESDRKPNGPPFGFCPFSRAARHHH